jgi:hypothetical protein
MPQAASASARAPTAALRQGWLWETEAPLTVSFPF